MNGHLCKAFWAALLLTGDVTRAEEAVQDAIEFLDADDLSSDALPVFVTTRALSPDVNEVDQPALPEELRNVMRLPRMLRECFVLRILLGFSEGRCARLLHARECQIAGAVTEAVSRLSLAVAAVDA